MANITPFECPVLLYENRRRRFRVIDADGRIVGRATPVEGGEGANGLARGSESGRSSPPFVVRFSGPADEALFTIERGQDGPGIVVRDSAGETLGRLGGLLANANALGAARLEGLVAADGTPFLGVAWKSPQGYESGKGFCEFVSADGQRVGRFDHGVLRFDYAFAWPLQALLVAAPILFYLRSDG